MAEQHADSGEARAVSVGANRQAGVYRPSQRAHVLFVGIEVVLLLLLGALALMVRAHPGPLAGDASVEVNLQHAFLHRGPVTSGIEGISTLNWPIPTVITLAIIILIFLLLRRWLDAIVVPLAALVEAASTYVLSTW